MYSFNLRDWLVDIVQMESGIPFQLIEWNSSKGDPFVAANLHCNLCNGQSHLSFQPVLGLRFLSQPTDRWNVDFGNDEITWERDRCARKLYRNCDVSCNRKRLYKENKTALSPYYRKLEEQEKVTHSTMNWQYKLQRKRYRNYLLFVYLTTMNIRLILNLLESHNKNYITFKAAKS